MSFTILADVTCDLSPELQKRFGIEVIPGHITLPDKTERASRCEWDFLPQKDFYASLRRKDAVYTTAPPNITEFSLAFQEHLKKGEDVLCLTISSGLSGTYDFACRGAEEAMAACPGRRVICVDTKRYTSLFGLMAIHASLHRAAGESLDETAAWLLANRDRFHQMGWLDDLTFVARKGRISGSAAFFGTLVGIKPLGEIDQSGKTTVLGKAKGERAALDSILRYMEKTIENPSEQIVVIAYSDRKRQAELLVELVRETFAPKEILLTEVYPANGINVGPGLMSAYYFGKPISEDLAEEKALIDHILGKA